MKIPHFKVGRKKIVMTASIVVVLLILFSSYAFILPAQQVKNYKKTVLTNQTELNGMVTDAGSFLYSNTYLKASVDNAQATTDIADGRGLADSAENQLNSIAGKLVDLGPAPGLGWVSKYKSAKQIQTDEKEYIANAREYVRQVRAMIDYTEATLALQKTTLNAANEMILAIQASSKTEAAAHVDTATAQMQEASNKYAKLKTTEETKAMHDYTADSLKKRIALLKDFSAAISTGEANKVIDTYNKLADLTNESVDKESDLAADAIRNSQISKSGAKLDALQQKISVEVSKL
ncbi:MAG TPA: hypothetical protein VJ843_05080 [Candidatus Saccharimonadales bacterium]|nr:hypothetical protein [Candidatus Saccharimonadales bacterium]